MKISALFRDLVFRNLIFISNRNRQKSGGRGRPPKDLNLIATILAAKIQGGASMNSFSHFVPESTLRYWRDLLVKNGFFQRVFEFARSQMLNIDGYDFEKLNFDSSNIKTPYGGELTGQNWKEKGRKGTKIGLLSDKNGMPLAFSLHSAQPHDIHSLFPTIDAFPHKSMLKNSVIQADKAFDSDNLRRKLRRRKIIPDIHFRNFGNKKRAVNAKNDRWIIEQSFAHMKQFETTRIRRERKLKNWQATVQAVLGMILIRRLQSNPKFNFENLLAFMAFCLAYFSRRFQHVITYYFIGHRLQGAIMTRIQSVMGEGSMYPSFKKEGIIAPHTPRILNSD